MNKEFFQPQGLTPQPGRGYANRMDSPEMQGGQGGSGEGLSPEMRAVLDRNADLAKALDGLRPGVDTIADVLSTELRQRREYQEEEAQESAPQKVKMERTERTLDNIVKTVGGEQDTAKLAKEGNYVLGMGRKMIANAQAETADESTQGSQLKQELEDAGVGDLVRKIEAAEKRSDLQSVRGEIAELAEAIKGIVHEPELKEFSYFDVPSSFEDLMQYIASSEDSKFHPGGEFALYEVQPIQDKSAVNTDSEGYVLEPIIDQGQFRGMKRKERIIPNYQNLRRWTKEKAKYFIGQNTFTPINLMNDISVPALSPLSINYILNNDRFWTQDKIVRKVVEVEYTEEQYQKLVEAHKADGITKTPDGRYVRSANDYVIEKDRKSPELSNLRDDLILTLFLTEWEHNSHVAYFSEGMASEKPLRETMQKIYNSNYLTRFLGLELHDASDSKFHNSNGDQQVKAMLTEGPTEMKKQGSVGKAKQRLWAAYNFLAESSAAANGWDIEGGVNPFIEVLRGKDGANDAEIFYKSLIRQSLETYYSSEIAGVKDLVEALNATDWRGRTDHPKRYDWEKVDIADFILLDGQELMRRLQRFNISSEDVQKARQQVGENYEKEDSKLTDAEKKQRKDQIQLIGKDDTRRRFLEMFAAATANGRPKMDFTQKDIQKGGAFYEFYDGKGYSMGNKKGDHSGLDFFAVKFATRPFDSDPNGARYAQDTNIFRNRRYSDEARIFVRKALTDVVIYTEKLDAFEAWWAEERTFRKTYITGISARNDVDAIGHDAWSKVKNTLAYRLRQADNAGNFYGMEETLFGPMGLGVDFLEGINYKMKGENGYNKPLFDLITGATEVNNSTGLRFDINEDIGEFELPGHVMAQFFADHFSNALSLWEMQQGPEGLDLVGKFVKFDTMGNPIYDRKAIKEFMDGPAKQGRYAWDNPNLLYNRLHAAWIKQTVIAKDAYDKPYATTKIVFGVRKLKDFMFSEEIQQMGMYARGDIASGKEGSKKGEEESKMARNVIGYLIAKQIQAHQAKEGYTYWNADAIQQIFKGFREYGIGALEMANGKSLFLGAYFTPEEIRTILGSAQVILWAVYFKDYKDDVMGGIAEGIFGLLNDLLADIGKNITLAK